MTPFGEMADGREVHAISLTSDQVSARILTYGAILNDVRLAGIAYPLTLGSPDLAAYEGPMASFGSLMGPVVNRIRDARADIAGRDYQFEKNFEGAHTLHSGSTGSHHQIWQIAEQTAASVTLALDLPDGLGGFPGDRRVEVTYTVDDASLTMDVTARTNAPTLFSFANHSYWALDAEPGFSGHQLSIPADSYLEAGPDLMPTGAEVAVAGTAYDARGGLDLAGDSRQFFDLNYCLARSDQPMRPVAKLRGASGVTMGMESTAPGLQVYDCGTIDAAGFATHHGREYGRYAGLALEAQAWPGAIQHAHFPSILHDASRPFRQTTRWSFGV
ncbi:MAG: aldose epimerase family protein [Pseudomonadota bacterium]